MHNPLHLPAAVQLQKVAMAIYKQTENGGLSAWYYGFYQNNVHNQYKANNTNGTYERKYIIK